jgi:hypothetical protein
VKPVEQVMPNSIDENLLEDLQGESVMEEGEISEKQSFKVDGFDRLRAILHMIIWRRMW